MNKTQKVVLVTGSSHGIGAATALKFASLGYRLALHARNLPIDEAGLMETKNRCLQINSNLTNNDILTITGDLSLEEDCQDMIKKTIEIFQRLDVLVANAGLYSRGGLEDLKMEDFDRIMGLNCRSVVYLNKLVIPYLSETKGNIVNVSSMAGLKPHLNMFAYGLSKAAVVHLTRSAASELGPKGIRVNAVCPGMISNTRILINAGLPAELMKLVEENSKTKYPIGRTGTPEEVAHSIAFLASDDQAYMTGVALSVDGGALVI